MSASESFVRVARCGCEYVSPHPFGRIRKFGDCNCESIAEQAKYIEQKCLRCRSSFRWKKIREYCSDACRATIARRRAKGIPVEDRELICERCGELFDAVRNSAKRCFDCQDRTLPVLESKTCPVCDEAFTPVRRGQRSCSNDCAQKYWKKYHRVPEPWDDQRRARYHKRRARKRELPADSIRPRDVYDRDEWICHICEIPVDESVKWPDPMSPSLDHVIPLSKGGHHVWENVALAHLDCNVRKGDRVSVD